LTGSKDLTERELLAWAVLEAMEDAGLEAKDVDAFFVAHTMSESLSRQVATFGSVADWIGMRWKPGFNHETACSSTTSGLKHAMLSVASGLHDIVLSAGVQIVSSRPVEGKPASMREAIPYPELSRTASAHTLDGAYCYPGGVNAAAIADLACTAYARTYGVTMEQVEEALNVASIDNRRHGVLNPLATVATVEFPDEARQKGFDDVMEFMRSDHNPRVALMLRLFNCALSVDGASALIVCPTDMAGQFVSAPIDVLGIGSSCTRIYHETDVVWNLEKEAFDQAYAMAGIDPYRDVDYMYVHDCFTAQQLTSTEAGGYFRRGEAWQAILDGRTRIEGDRPLSTTGGRTSMGHAFSATGGCEVTEAVRQMRGLCGARQVKPVPELSVVHNMGGGMHCNVVVLGRHS
jgi:acetyl-CoA acetyltransferase